MSFWVYILRCADNSYYTEHTDNLENVSASTKRALSRVATRSNGAHCNLCFHKIAPPAKKRWQQSNKSKAGAEKRRKP